MTNILLFNVRYLYLQLRCSFFSITICTHFDMTIHFGGGELRGDQINHALEKTTTSKQIHKGCLDLW